MSEPTTSTAPPGWRRGPVAITGASGQVGTALQRRLAAFPNQVRPLGRGDDLATAFADAEVVIHLAGTLQPREPNSYTAANLGSVRATVAALAGSRVQRVVFLSFASADPCSPNPYLRAKAAALGHGERSRHRAGDSMDRTWMASRHRADGRADDGPVTTGLWRLITATRRQHPPVAAPPLVPPRRIPWSNSYSMS